MTIVRFHVLDALCRGGSPSRPNDDAYGVSRRAAFVLDGATGVGDTPLLPGPSDAQWVAIEAAAMFAGLCDQTREPLSTLVSRTVDHLVTAFMAQRSRAPAGVYEIPFASLMMIASATDTQFDVGWFGDCRLVAQDANGSLATAGPGLKAKSREQDRAREMAKSVGVGAAVMERRHSLPLLREQRNRVNSGEGTGALGPDERCLPLLRRKSVPLSLPATALLMTDGFYALVTDYLLYDDSQLMEAAQECGLASLCGELRAFEARDADGTRFPRYKTHDDATALLVSICEEKSAS